VLLLPDTPIHPLSQENIHQQAKSMAVISNCGIMTKMSSIQIYNTTFWGQLKQSIFCWSPAISEKNIALPLARYNAAFHVWSIKQNRK
jgi:hypothetical protein